MFPTNASFGSYYSTDSDSERVYLSLRRTCGESDFPDPAPAIPSATGSFYGNSGIGTGMGTNYSSVRGPDGTYSIRASPGSSIPWYMVGAGSYANVAGSNGASSQHRGVYNDGVGIKASSVSVDEVQDKSGLCSDNVRVYEKSSGNVQMR